MKEDLSMIEAIMSAGFALVTLFVGYCIAEVRRVKKEVVDIVNREKHESIVASRRLDVIDGSISEIAESKMNSRNVVEKGNSAPRIHPKILRFIYGVIEG